MSGTTKHILAYQFASATKNLAEMHAEKMDDPYTETVHAQLAIIADYCDDIMYDLEAFMMAFEEGLVDTIGGPSNE